MNGQQRLQAQEKLRKLTLVHPELGDFLSDPDGFSTAISFLPMLRRYANDLHLRENVRYCPLSRRKFISCDAEVAELFQQAYGRQLPAFLGAGGPREELCFDPHQVNVGIVVAGGTAPGTNAAIHWIVKRHAENYGLTTGRIYGFIGGFRGLGRKGEANVRPLTPNETELYFAEPGCFLGMSRHREKAETLVDTLQALQIDILYVIGGDGTLDAGHRIWQEIERRNLRIVVAGIPKTIDNDIVWCWKPFGFETATDEATKQIRAFHANVRTHSRIGLFIMYGGSAGFLAANAGQSSGVADAVLIPEETVSLAGLLKYAERCIARQNFPLEDHALFVISEGIGWEPPIWDEVARELFQQKLIPSLDYRVPREEGPNEAMRRAFCSVLYRAFIERFGNSRHTPVITEPRSLISSVAPSARDIRYCQRLAYNAVDNALAGFTDFMSSYWLTEYVLVPLNLVAGKTRLLPIQGSLWANIRSSTEQPSW